MTVPRIYVPPGVEVGAIYRLKEKDFFYAKSVLRMREGERIILFDGAGREYESIVHCIDRTWIDVKVIEKVEIPRSGVNVTLLQALPKGSKMDFIVQKATELGVSTIIPFLSDRTVPKLSPEKKSHRVARWCDIAIEASRQCRRADIPSIQEILTFHEAVRMVEGVRYKIIFWEESPQKNLNDALKSVKEGKEDHIVVAIGPEGGFTAEEIGKAQQGGFVSVNLGRTIFKVETAVMVVLSIIQYEGGMFAT